MTNPHEHWNHWSHLYKKLGCIVLAVSIVGGIWAASGRWHIRQVEAALLPETVQKISAEVSAIRQETSAEVSAIQEDVDTIEEWIVRADSRWVWQACVAVAAPGYVCDQHLDLEDRIRLREIRRDAERRNGDDQ